MESPGGGSEGTHPPVSLRSIINRTVLTLWDPGVTAGMVPGTHFPTPSDLKDTWVSYSPQSTQPLSNLGLWRCWEPWKQGGKLGSHGGAYLYLAEVD